MSDVAARIAELGPWFHNLNLDGIETAPNHPLGDYPSFKFEGFKSVLPDDLSGRSVLDIGCNAGFYAIEMWRRGADRVLGIDNDPRYLAQARLAAEVTGAKIDLRQMSVYEVADLQERFDLVLFMGVFYHLRHPLLALDLLRTYVTREHLLFQSMQRGDAHPLPVSADYPFEDSSPFQRPDWPRLHFVEHRYAGDPTNWFIPNAAAVEAMLRSAGFTILQRPEPEVYLCRTSDMQEGAPSPSIRVRGE
ncbi:MULTISPECIES: TIGR04290 family methyltransferase [unclassified Salipiger]|uniref:TIGR04290 family methyltransferase n=1 Tax=unclassified Salipiger TaxID=2640570 RepID=UPI0013B69D6E|nr:MULTISPECIES: TIGR04290 family methyltransferase [unclassified Salipiger]NDV49290.1 TIGR04290 family methyltransferase [Salipiger sp. PrR003]NDW32763.1 TIGR04290 family methyltransferase [Salipiger sp. PrR007]